MKNTKTLVLSPTFSITINVCDRDFITPLDATPEEREAIGQAYVEQSEFWQALRALPADLTDLDLEPLYELAKSRAEQREIYIVAISWRPKFTELSDTCNAPILDRGQQAGSGQHAWAEAHMVKRLRANADELEAIHKRAERALRKAGLNFDDLRRYDAYRGTFWLRESEEDVESIVLRAAEIVREDSSAMYSDGAEKQAAEEFYEAKK